MTHLRGSTFAWAHALVVTIALATVPALGAVTTTLGGRLDDPSNTALIGSGPAPSAPDFTDDFAIANNVAVYALSTGASGVARFQSFGFALGGVDPYFTLFSGAGPTATFLESNDAQAFSTGGDFDLQLVLPAGTYTIALGAFANMSFAENSGFGTLADGFIGLGEAFSLGNGAGYRLVVTTVPEPATLLLVASPFCALLALRSRRRGSSSQTGSRSAG